jgi:hypothetical protein
MEMFKSTVNSFLQLGIKIYLLFLIKAVAKLRWLDATPQTVRMRRQGEVTTPTSVLRQSY